MRLTAWGQCLVLLVALSFGRASVAPPCAAHDEPLAVASQLSTESAHQHGQAPATGHGDHGMPHDGACTCLDDCHGGVPSAWVGSDPIRVADAGQTVARTHAPPLRLGVSLPRHPHSLPFATAPPTPGT